ncbi:S41 family peptidase [Roseateles sp. BYS78W]|uniref:S41 family peptidase n=1 Tax=Pelomonas candidula TaxID=3299025 RepID=A0ABW7H6H0_9BURK
MTRTIRGAALLAAALGLALSGCGGGGGSGGSVGAPVVGNPDTPLYGPAGPSSSFAQQCASNNTLAAGNLRTASLSTEKSWLRAYFDEAYLWRDEVPSVNPNLASYSGSDTYVAMDNYFEALKTTGVTGSGQLRDRFSFTYPTTEWQALSGSGVEAGYGIEWTLASVTPPRQIRVAYVEAGSPADLAGIVRGDQLVTADGTSADTTSNTGTDALNAALYPGQAGTAHNFTFTRNGGATITRSLTSAAVTRTPVPIAKVVTTPLGTKAGYVLFNDHNAPSEAQLITAMRSFQTQGVQELVLDLRYNGGGYLYIASELATMIAGTTRTAGQAFETLKYSAKRSSENTTTPFFTTSCNLVGNSCTTQDALPTLNLARVYVLAQSGTCSASESVINSLRGVGVDVVLVGGKTCGKPYGFTPRDNCGVTYFPIEFAGVNAQGFGDYADGFEPSATGTAGTRFVKGCTVADDMGHALGDTSESMLASALGHVDRGSCPVLASGSSATVHAQSAASGEGGSAALTLRRNPARNNRIWLGR